MRWLFALLTLSLPVRAAAFEIGTVASDPCHERILLAALGVATSPWEVSERAEVDDLVLMLEQRALSLGAPTDTATRSFVDSVAELYGFGHVEGVRRWILASFVLGVREPDTRGFAIVRLNETRETHLADSDQGRHSLRRSSADGEEGNAAAIAETLARIQDRMGKAREAWLGSEAIVTARWTFSFYGDVSVNVLGSAFHMGEMVHTVQDGYTHMLRDEALRVVTVLNFREAVSRNLDEDRDGIAHSERLDRCDIGHDSFDALRVNAARDATADVLIAAYQSLEADVDNSPLTTVLDRVYELRPGCRRDNDYCGTSWLSGARESPSESIRIAVCSVSPMHGASTQTLAAFALAWLLLLRRREEKP